jgi:hypothetical protein
MGKKHSLLCKIGVKGTEKTRSRPLKDISNLGCPLTEIFKKKEYRNTTVYDTVNNDQ